MTRLLIVGATGLVGRIVLEKALSDLRIERIVAPTRRALPSDPKLINPLVDFAALPADAAWWATDGVISSLGTTKAATPSPADYRAIDLGYTLAAARLALRHGATRYALVSAMGASTRSPFFYPRLKGEIERDVLALGYPSTTIVRPGMIGGDRKEFRAGELGIARVLGALAPLLPRRFRVSQAERIAAALIEAALSAAPGRHFIEADALSGD
jgi:uncharacterized protein YbjT (DUF2867 family)